MEDHTFLTQSLCTSSFLLSTSIISYQILPELEDQVFISAFRVFVPQWHICHDIMKHIKASNCI